MPDAQKTLYTLLLDVLICAYALDAAWLLTSGPARRMVPDCLAAALDRLHQPLAALDDLSALTERERKHE